ncbi:MAG: hypothetical protein H5U08_13845 [Thermogutta sp.]|uniref:DUF6666 family protein n=1 Tax=Thermogutta sp. TaxID=1962930 RepID=UPI00199EBDFE|nr:DUF6666 family protein [Thermogutta sp.]MBC7353438.1 hypothetical protein [Thermogutta sp.]
MSRQTTFAWCCVITVALSAAVWDSPGVAAETEYVERATGSPVAYWSSQVLRRQPPSIEEVTRPPARRVSRSHPAVRTSTPGEITYQTLPTSQEAVDESSPEVIPPGQPVITSGMVDEEGVETGLVEDDGVVYEPGGFIQPEIYYGGGLLFGPWIQHLSVFAGAHGFKGPADLGRNGNFGLHEGLNYSAPIGGPWNIGYQIGVQVVHSDFPGHEVLTWYGNDLVSRGSRAQMFLTAGLFHRPDCGRWQWSVLFDWMHDDFWVDSDLLQIRHEISFFLDDMREIGYMGMYGVKDDMLLLPDDPQNPDQRRYLDLSVLDRYVVFYRRHFCQGGEGRFWAGVSGYGDGLIGADITLPLDGSWAFEANFAYLAPNTGRGVDGQFDENWSLSMGLIWYPGRHVSEALNDLFRSVQGVADNTSMMFHGRVR